MKRISALFLIYALVGFAPAQTCTPPTVTNRWLPSICTGIECLADATGHDNATPTMLAAPKLSGGGLVFDGASTYLTLTTPISITTPVYSFYAVLNPASMNGAIVGNSTSENGVAWWLNRYTATPALNVSGTDGTPATAPTQLNTTWVIAATYTVATKTVNYWSCTLTGTCTAAGSSTLTGTPTVTSPITTIGDDAYFSYFSGTLIELGFNPGPLDTTALGTYAACQYGTTVVTPPPVVVTPPVTPPTKTLLGNQYVCTGVSVYSDLSISVPASNCTPPVTGVAAQ